MVHFEMVCGILDEDLIGGVGPNSYENSLKLPATKKFDVTVNPMKGWVMVAAKGE